MNADLTEYFEELKFGEIQHQGSMAVLPVFSNHESELHYMTLTNALKADLVEISEMNEMGTVSELKVHNSADVPVLILDGEELVGAKQNRIVNTTILLKERSLTVIPVSCVEQGRWSYKSRKFQDSSRLAHSKLRNLKSVSVKKSVEEHGQHFSDQGELWNAIHEIERKTDLHSPTSAMTDIYDEFKDDLTDYLETFKVVEGQTGLLVFINGEIMGLDIISNKSAYKVLHKKLVESYALDSMLQDNKKTSPNINIEVAHKFIEDIRECDESKNESVGYGFDHRFASDLYIGSALVFNNELIHASFFKSLEVEDGEIGGMARSTVRANLRGI